ncbi:MAG TPA: exodeoxyribonuclease V subunit gamma, partial [Kofleriaceae bacterium]|nr:exodeoxyribonuclease V subunit gamma [Kofleriaceae bacterium]
AATEAWQRILWQRAIGGGVFRALPELFDRIAPDQLALPPRIYVFGFSYLAPAYYRIFSKLADRGELWCYALNPCREFWEDSAGRGQPVETEQPALRLWGRPGRENVRALDALANFDSRFVEPAPASPATALSRLQHDIAARADQPSEERLHQDDSVRVLACPSVQRELEIIASEIWRLMRADETLRFNEVAVLVAPGAYEHYHAHVRAVFSESHRMPHHLVDVPLSSESRIVEAFDMLLALPLGGFTRPELLRLLAHPSVCARFPDADPSDWGQWIERLGIVHGADHGDHAGTYIERDVYNWNQGITRLALGAFMTSDPGAVVSLPGGDYVPEPLDGDELASASALALLARSLIADARFCRAQRLPLAAWRELLEHLLTTYIVPGDDADERNLARCRDAVAGLAELDMDQAPVSYRIASELVRAGLGGLRGARGERFADGVTVAPLAPMRAFPYRVIFVAGLGEGQFPGTDRESPLDLRTAEPRASDVSPRERDRYVFLETLLGARDKLYLTYVSRDEQTGETLEPSSVVVELRHMLRGYLDDDAARALTVRHPLRRYDPAYHPELFGRAAVGLPSASPAARKQAQAHALRLDLERHFREHGAEAPEGAAIRAHVSEADWQRLDAHLELSPRAPSAATDSRVTIDVPLWAVRRFLECPLQAWAAAVLGLRETEIDDVAAHADEPFGVEPLDRALMLRTVFGEHLRHGGDLEALEARYRDAARRRELTGTAPTGLFADLTRREHLEVLRAWHGGTRELAGPFVTYCFGRAPEHRDVDRALPPVILEVPLPGDGDGRVTRVELYGASEIVAGEHTSLTVAAGKHAHKKYRLRGFIDHVVLAAAGISEAPHRIVTVTGSGQLDRVSLGAWSREDARAYLTELLGELLGAPHEYLLPCEAVLERKGEQTAGDRTRALLSPSNKGGFSSRYGPVRRIEHLRIPDDAEADAMIGRRFQAYFDRVEDAG